jgi:quercetin dioxygenase-like cupin family protein
MPQGGTVKWEDATPVEMLPGLIRRTLGYTDDLMVVEFQSEAGVVVPLHTHPHDQVGYMVSGQMDITIDGVTKRVGPGDSYFIPGDMEHGATFVTESRAIDAFTPPREDYL